MEVVRVTEEFITPKMGWNLVGEIGFVLGWAEAADDRPPDVGVFFNSYGEMIGVPEDRLESVGRIAQSHEIIPKRRDEPRGFREALKQR